MSRTTILVWSGVALLVSTAFLVREGVVRAQAGDRAHDAAVQHVLHALDVDEHVSYEGVRTTRLESPKLSFEMSMRIRNTAGDPEALEREVLLPVVLDGEPVTLDDEDVEIIERRRSFRGTQQVLGQGGKTPLMSGGGSRATNYPSLFDIGDFEIVDTALFLANYDVRPLALSEGASKQMLGRSVTCFHVTPRVESLPSYRLTIDERTALILDAVVEFPTHGHASVRFSYETLTVEDEGLPLEQRTIEPLRLPSSDSFELSPAAARDVIASFRMPTPSELPRGFRPAGLRELRQRGQEPALRLDLSNGVASCFVIVRPAAFHSNDPVDAALRRLGTELGLDELPAEQRDAVLEANRPNVERVFHLIESAGEAGGQANDRTARVAWRRSQSGITRVTVYSTEVDVLAVGPLRDRELLDSIEYLVD